MFAIGVGHSDDAIHRGSDFVTHICKELTLCNDSILGSLNRDSEVVFDAFSLTDFVLKFDDFSLSARASRCFQALALRTGRRV